MEMLLLSFIDGFLVFLWCDLFLRNFNGLEIIDNGAIIAGGASFDRNLLSSLNVLVVVSIVVLIDD
jgi:hypothetical protein